MFICPQQLKWYEIYEALKSAWLRSGKRDPRPPVPLILSGWNYSNDVQKKDRWEATVRWAKNYRFEQLIPELSAEDSYFAEEPSNYPISPSGGRMFLEWNRKKKSIPSREAVNQALKTLKEQWQTIAGKNLGSMTTPVQFTGRKKRRLLVWADKNSNPGWGTWFELSPIRYEREEFTLFRSSVNKAISPLHVDHIDFITD